MFNPHIEYRLYREETARLEKQLELRRMLPQRERRRLPSLGHWTLIRRRRPIAPEGGC